MTRIEPGQLRRWLRPDHPRDIGRVFLIVERSGSDDEPIWSFIIDGRREWHFEDVIELDTELVSDVYPV